MSQAEYVTQVQLTETLAQYVTQQQLRRELFFQPEEYLERVNRVASFIKEKLPPGFVPKVALTLGSGGLGDISDDIIPVIDSINYEDIPDFLTTTVEGHEGELVIGTLSGVPVIGFSGRKHVYEDGPQPNPVTNIKNVVLPVYVAKALGAEIYFATNAAGGLNSSYNTGDFMIVESHNGLFFQNPLEGRPANLGNEFYFQPQYMEYNDFLRSVLKTAAANVDESSHMHEGTYTALMGRTYETKAESQALRALGADAVGMSTVPEIITAANLGMETLAFSLITNVIEKDGSNKTSHEEVMAALKAPETRKRVHEVTKEFFRILNNAKWDDERVIDLIIKSKTRK